MKETSLEKIISHPEKDELISKLVLNVSPQDINEYLRVKYADVEGKKFILSTAILKDFKDTYLNLYQKIQSDALQLKTQTASITEEATQLVENNSAYRQRLLEYVDKEIDLKTVLRNMVIIIEHRIEQMYNIIQENPTGFKPDYILIQYFNTFIMAVEKANDIINGSPDQIIQQNNINIQIVDQHIGVFHKVIREILSKLDYETSLYFIELFNEEMKKIKEVNNLEIPVDIRLEETKKLTSVFED